MKLKLLALLCAFCLLAGCKIETPAQHNQSESNSVPSSALSSEAVSSGAGTSVPPVSQAEPSSSASSSASPESAPGSAKVASTAPQKAVSSKPPVKPQSAAPPSSAVKESSCTISISASDIWKNKERFSADELSIVPKDGILLSDSKMEIKNGETVYNVLLRATKANSILMEHVTTAFQSEYIRSIANIKEKQFGKMSGWTYLVNGKQPPVACSDYKLSAGDKIQWIYFCGDSQ